MRKRTVKGAPLTQGYDQEFAVAWEADIPSLTEALKALGPVVYAIRLSDRTIKIGHSTDLATRRRRFGKVGSYQIIALRRGTIDDELAIHAQLKPAIARGREYYHPTPEVLAVVNDMRVALGLGTLSA